MFRMLRTIFAKEKIAVNTQGLHDLGDARHLTLGGPSNNSPDSSADGYEKAGRQGLFK